MSAPPPIQQQQEAAPQQPNPVESNPGRWQAKKQQKQASQQGKSASSSGSSSSSASLLLSHPQQQQQDGHLQSAVPSTTTSNVQDNNQQQQHQQKEQKQKQQKVKQPKQPQQQQMAAASSSAATNTSTPPLASTSRLSASAPVFDPTAFAPVQYRAPHMQPYNLVPVQQMQQAQPHQPAVQQVRINQNTGQQQQQQQQQVPARPARNQNQKQQKQQQQQQPHQHSSTPSVVPPHSTAPAAILSSAAAVTSNQHARDGGGNETTTGRNGGQQQQPKQQKQQQQPKQQHPQEQKHDHEEKSGRRKKGKNQEQNNNNEETPVAASSSSTLASATVAFDSSQSKAPRSSPPQQHSSSKAQQIWREGHIDNSLLAKSITEQLQTNKYDCSICSETVGRRGKVWSCSQCHIILHLSCIQKWYDSNKKQNLGDDSYRCPGCQFIHTEPPGDYFCFCGKTFEPDTNPYLTPHSCGQICGKKKNCGVHTCSLPCHPGHCTKCTLPGQMQPCACGQTEYRLKCGEEGKERIMCGKVCGKKLGCGDDTHTCQQQCHLGQCAPCETLLEMTCFCGQSGRVSKRCGSAEIVKEVVDDSFSFSCARTCAKKLDCGEHTCSKQCHAGSCAPCSRQVPRGAHDVQSCACGKVTHSVSDITAGKVGAEWRRTTCRSPLPSCGAKCGKLLNCSFHTCTLVCHDENIPCGLISTQKESKVLSSAASSSSSSSSCSSSSAPSGGCTELVKRQCRCSLQQIVEVPCTSIRGDTLRGIPPPSSQAQAAVLCDTKCKVKLACKIHRCQNTCCPRGESHVCLKVCGKPLGCNDPTHMCDAFCHTGPCKPCAVVYRDGLACACGQTRTAPNIKCGTSHPPYCSRPCTRVRPCGHPCLQTCHQQQCAPCVTLVNKTCAGGHKVMKSIPCYASPSCGVTCKKILKCGVHTCLRPCHGGKCSTTNSAGNSVAKAVKPVWGASSSSSSSAMKASMDDDESKEDGELVDGGEEDDALQSCGQKCGLLRSDCGHPCSSPCHPDLPCPTNVKCREQIRIYCGCRRLSKVKSCGDEQTHLVCVAQCEVETRNARLRDALQVDADRVVIPYPAEYLDQVITLDLFDFVIRMERVFAEFLQGSSNTKTFNPMPQSARWLLHQLSSYHNMESESFDQAPKRSVRIVKSERSCQPAMKLSEAIKLYRASKGPVSASTPTSSSKVGTLAPTNVLHIFDLDQEPTISSYDLSLMLKQYSSYETIGGVPNPTQGWRMNWLDDSRAMIVFNDSNLASSIRAVLERRNLFRFDPDELASRKAIEAYHHGGYNKNSLFRKRSASVATAQAPMKRGVTLSGFDEWSEQRTGRTGASSASSASAAASSNTSSWDAPGTSYSSDSLTDAQFEAFLAKSAASSSSSAVPASASASSTPQISPSSSSSSHISSGMAQPMPSVHVSTSNAWVLLDEDATNESAVRTASSTEASPKHGQQADSPTTVEDGDWIAIATTRKVSNEAAPAKSAFDD